MKIASPNSRPELLFRAFSDRTRLRILGLLVSGELCVCDLVQALRLSQPKISRHLAYLRKAGLVAARREGYWSYYRLTPAHDSLQRQLRECLACCLKAHPIFAKDATALRQCRGKNCC